MKHLSNLNADNRIRILQAKLNKTRSSLNRKTRQQIPIVQQELIKAYNDEEQYWKDKSRNQWLREGDCYTCFFHATTKVRFSKNRLTSIQNDQGITFLGDTEIGHHAQDFFTQIYKSNGRQVSVLDFADVIPTVIPAINEELEREFTDTEIYNAVSLIGDDKALGPDGLTATFYKRCWDIVGKDVVREVRQYFATGKMKPGVNHTNICMIPKITNPVTLSYYRPMQCVLQDYF